jgi:hypothetical protein
LTICTKDRECLFGEVVDGEMRLNEAGTLVRNAWDALPFHYPGVETDEFVVMPNHVHGIVVLSEHNVGDKRSVGAQFIAPASVAPASVAPASVAPQFITPPMGTGASAPTAPTPCPGAMNRDPTTELPGAMNRDPTTEFPGAMNRDPTTPCRAR